MLNMKYYIVAILFVSVLGTSKSHSVILVVPEFINKRFANYECKQVSNFYSNNLGIRNPPYVFDLFSLNTNKKSTSSFHPYDIQQSFAAWCTRDMEYYLLVEPMNIDVGFGECDGLHGPYDIVGGLTVIRGKNEPIAWYRDTSEDDVADEKTRGPIISSTYDGLGFHFYCDKGVLLNREVH